MNDNNNNKCYLNAPRRPPTSTDWSNDSLRRVIGVNRYYEQQPNYSSISSFVPSAPPLEESLPPPYTEETSNPDDNNNNNDNNSPKRCHHHKQSHHHRHHSHLHHLNARALPVANYRQWEVNRMVEPTPLPPSATVRYVVIYKSKQTKKLFFNLFYN